MKKLYYQLALGLSLSMMVGFGGKVSGQNADINIKVTEPPQLQEPPQLRCDGGEQASELVKLYYLRSAETIKEIIKKIAESSTCSKGTVIEAQGNNTIVLYGKEEQREELKRVITTLDLPREGVNMEMWGILISSDNPEQLAEVMGEVNREIDRTQRLIQDTYRQLEEQARKIQIDTDYENLFENILGYSDALDPNRASLSMTDILLRMNAAKYPIDNYNKTARNICEIFKDKKYEDYKNGFKEQDKEQDKVQDKEQDKVPFENFLVYFGLDKQKAMELADQNCQEDIIPTRDKDTRDKDKLLKDLNRRRIAVMNFALQYSHLAQEPDKFDPQSLQLKRGILSEDGLAKDKDGLAKVVKNATDDWLDSVGWGLAYPDLVRVIGFPFLTPKPLDRGYALEKDWQRTLKKPTLTLDDWYKKAKQGEIPIPVFNSTLVENGRRFLISPMKFIPGEIENYFNKVSESELSEEDKQKIRQSRALDLRTLYNYCGKPEDPKPCNLDVTTAARLSASFPYVSPMARNDIDNIIRDSKTHKPLLRNGEQVRQNYHMADGGYFDNAGAFTAIEWLDEFLEKNAEDLNIKKVVLLQINAFPEVLLEPQQKGDKGFKTVLLGPLNALNGVRNSTQIARNIQAVELLKDSWNNNGKGISIQEFAISFPATDKDGNGYNQPLSWRLTKRQKDNLKNAWETDPTIRDTVNSIKAFWNNGQKN